MTHRIVAPSTATGRVCAPVTDLSEFKKKPQHPTGWEPSLQWDGKKGTLTTGPLDSEPDTAIWEQLIADWGLDPTRTEVVDGSLQIRAWDTMRDGETIRMKYYRATIAPRTHFTDRADIDALCKLVERKKPRAVTPPDGSGAFVVLLSDWQLGKGEGGGSETTTARILGALDKSVSRYKELKKLGRVSQMVYLVGLGDLVEGCSQFYEMQEWQTDLNRREQERLARRLILAFIDAYVDLGCEIVAMGVPGNHGENRRNGKAFTDFTDNADVAAFETVSEILASNPERYNYVSIPLNALNPDDLTLTLDISGVPVAFAHGHQFRSGTNSQAKVEGWWKGQALGRTGVADAQILCTGHLHHFVMSEATGRTFIQVPAMDGGSKWFVSTTGQDAPAGMVSFVASDQTPRGWRDLAIL